ncbi:Na+/H+ antiporter NhaD/arsenite permease-like protein [Methylopila capsulata]|uniref:Anion transporter n=1 Tax=Methylopila capsulata TaxID=61654 RepID=A0A9W6IXT1_9HYPH|nr:SLC13 family permease [Methylopila capsulata]MBM7852909.1 Na+/H+ antiporter NhaD/arsenite permease-like protein [Methylopila capsulata]GLK57120.1 anion transporter [Methylopila capsulata]
MPFDLTTAAAVLVFVATYGVVAFGRAPFVRIDRAGAALAGGAAMVGLGVLTPEDAFAAVDHNTIVLLLGMMIVVANLKLSGFFALVNAAIAARVRHAFTLLVAVALAAGALSAFLVNDTVCLVMTPLVMALVLKLKRNPVPYAIAIAIASNVGSVATITGNPQNMIIGSLSGVPYATFAATLAPVAAAGLALTIVFVAVAFRREFLSNGAFAPADDEAAAARAQVNRPLAIKTGLVAAAMVAAFFLGAQIATAAIVAGAALLLTRRVKPARVWAEIDWPLLVMFAGLFVVTAGVEKALITPDVVKAAGRLALDDTAVLSLVTAALSNVVSNVPAVLVLEPFVKGLADPQRAWLVVAMASTLAGNFTLVGSIANLIVAERARAFGVDVDFWTYFKVGAPLTLATIAVGVFLV